jgi:hypothetical protein
MDNCNIYNRIVSTRSYMKWCLRDTPSLNTILRGKQHDGERWEWCLGSALHATFNPRAKPGLFIPYVGGNRETIDYRAMGIEDDQEAMRIVCTGDNWVGSKGFDPTLRKLILEALGLPFQVD